jgi:uncharacterized protein
MQYVLQAYDYTDGQALNRRMEARPAHFERARQLKAEGHFLFGGALLSPEGSMIGSLMILEFESEKVLNEWLDTEPYLLGKVWENVEVKPFRQADI